MNTGFDYFIRGEVFPFASSNDTAGFAYWNRGEVYPAIYYIAPVAATATGESASMRMIRFML